MSHTCHWPGCKRDVPPAMWGCKEHWFTLPKRLRDEIWRTYVPGQEITKTPSEAYLIAADNVQRWIRIHERQNTQAGAGVECEQKDSASDTQKAMVRLDC